MTNIEQLARLYTNQAVEPKDLWLYTFCEAMEVFEEALTDATRENVVNASAAAYRQLAKKYPYTTATSQPEFGNPVLEFRIVDKGSRRYVALPAGRYKRITVLSHSKRYKLAGDFKVSTEMLIEVEGPHDNYRTSWTVAIQTADGDGFIIKKPAGDIGSAQKFLGSWRSGTVVYPALQLALPVDELCSKPDITATEEFQ